MSKIRGQAPAAWLAVIALVAIGLGLAVISSVALWRKWAARERQRAAGIKAPTFGAEIKESIVLIRAALRRRRSARREQSSRRNELRRAA